MIAILMAGPKRWRIEPSARAGCGTAFPTRSATRSSNWRWSSPSCQPRELAVRFTDEKSYFVSEAIGLPPAQGP